MKLKLELDLENPIASMVYLDDKKVGGIQRISMSADIERNTFFVDLNGIDLAAMKEQRKAGTFVGLHRFCATALGKLFGPQDSWTCERVAELAKRLEDNSSKK